MIVDDTLVEDFNKRLYVHIHTFEYKGETIYYFANLQDRLFCTKEGNNFKIITDNYKKWLFINVFGLANYPKLKSFEPTSKTIIKRALDRTHLKIRRIATKHYTRSLKRTNELDERRFKEELKAVVLDMKEKYNLDIDLDECRKTVEKIHYYESPDNKVWDGMSYYNLAIALTESAKNENDIAIRTRIHEGIHALTGFNQKKYNRIIPGMLEGETENLVNDYMGEQGSSSMTCFGETTRQAIFNLNGKTRYKSNVCIVKQMEIALGKKSYDSILKGDMRFEKGFILQYGLIPFIRLASYTNEIRRLEIDTLANPILDSPVRIMLLERAQNYLLKTVFNKDFKNVRNIKDAKRFLKKLRSMDSVRARTTSGTRENALTENQTYKLYCEKIHSSLISKLERLGYTKEQIEHKLYEENSQSKKSKENDIEL